MTPKIVTRLANIAAKLAGSDKYDPTIEPVTAFEYYLDKGVDKILAIKGVPAVEAGDKGKVLSVSNSGAPVWVDKRPLILEFSSTNPYKVNTPLADIKSAIDAGRQVFFKGVFTVGNGADAYLPLSAYGLQTGYIIYLAFGGEYASQLVVFDDAGDGWTTNEI